MFTKFKKYWAKIGPGVVTGAADDDPSGIATYSQTGAQYGFGLLWTAVFTFPFMAVVQEMCARIGMVTGRGLAGTIRMYCPPYILYSVTMFLVLANTFNIGADISAIGEATQLIFPNLSIILIVISFTLISLLFQIFIPYQRYARYMKYLSFVLIVYIIVGLSINVDWKEVMYATFIPTSFTFTKDSVLLICALLGTTISPYLFFWQTSQEVEEKIAHHKGDTSVNLPENALENLTENEMKESISDMRFDVWSGMFFSNLVMFFIILVCGAVLFPNGVRDIQTAGQAAQALLPIAGNATYILFTLGIVGTGLLAVPVLAGSSAYAIAETFRIEEGLYKKYREAPAFYVVIIMSMILGLGMTFVGISPMKALIYSAVLNGLIAPLLLVVIVYLGDREEIMGKYKNSKLQSTLGWLIMSIMTIASTATIYFLI